MHNKFKIVETIYLKLPDIRITYDPKADEYTIVRSGKKLIKEGWGYKFSSCLGTNKNYESFKTIEEAMNLITHIYEE